MGQAVDPGVENGWAKGQPERQHCHDLVAHPKHTWEEGAVENFCDGVEPLPEFLELTIRVPLADFFAEGEYTTDEIAEDVIDEGLGTFFFDEIGVGGRAVGALRVRYGTQDVSYPVRDGLVRTDG